MRKLSAFFLLLLVACESRQSRNVHGNAPEGAKLLATVEEREKLHEYQVRVRWQGMGNMKPTLKRQAGSRPPETVGKINAPDGEFVDQSVSEGETYTFFLDNVQQAETSSTTAKIPRDFDSDELQGTPLFVGLLGYGRVAIQTLRSHGDIRIIAQKLIAKGYGSIIANASGEPAAEGKDGGNGNKITIDVTEAIGPFAFYSQGQRGGPPKKGAAGETLIPAGKGGKGGPIDIIVRKKGQFDLTVLLTAAWGGADSKRENMGTCETVSLRLPDDNNLVASCQYLSPGWEGLYAINGEHWMLAPPMNNFRVHVSPTDEIQLEWKGIPAEWMGGMGVGFRSYGSTPEIHRVWGKYINNNLAFAAAIRPAERTESMKKLQAILESLSRLGKIFHPQGMTLSSYFHSGVVLNFEKMSSLEFLKSLESKSAELIKVMKSKKLTTMHFMFGTERDLGDSIQEYPTWLAVSGNPALTVDQLIEAIEKGTLPKGAIK